MIPRVRPIQLGGETHWEYMVMALKKGKVPAPAPRLQL